VTAASTQVRMLVHCTTQPGAKRGLDIGFSLCIVPNYLILMSKYFICVLGVLRISGSVWKLSRSLEVNPELSVVQREVSVEVKNKSRALEVTGLFLEVQNRGSRFKVVKTRSSRQ